MTAAKVIYDGIELQQSQPLINARVDRVSTLPASGGGGRIVYLDTANGANAPGIYFSSDTGFDRVVGLAESASLYRFMGAGVTTKVALTAVPFSEYFDKQCRLVEENGCVYRFDLESTAIVDNNFVVASNGGAGRWLKVQGGSNTFDLLGAGGVTSPVFPLDVLSTNSIVGPYAAGVGLRLRGSSVDNTSSILFTNSTGTIAQARIDSLASNDITFQTGVHTYYNLSLRIKYVANSVNSLAVGSAITENSPFLLAESATDVNVGFNTFTKGAGVFSIAAYGETLSPVKVLSVRSSTITDNSWIEISSQLNSAYVQTISASSSADLYLCSKAAGYIYLGANHSSTYKTGLEIRALSNTVNRFVLSAAASTFAPIFSVFGSDVNVSMYLTAQGAGHIVSTSTFAVGVAELFNVTAAGAINAVSLTVGNSVFSGQLVSSLTTGTAPFSVVSTTIVPNLYVARSALADTATALATSRTINGVSFDGTSSITIGFSAAALTGTTLASNIITSSLTSVGTLGNLSVTGTTSSGSFSGPLTGNVTGNVTGSAATVTTNANLTGPITSSGNATAVANQTGTGSVFVMQVNPTLTTPILGVATATSLLAGYTTALWGETFGTSGACYVGGAMSVGLTNIDTSNIIKISNGYTLTGPQNVGINVIAFASSNATSAAIGASFSLRFSASASAVTLPIAWGFLVPTVATNTNLTLTDVVGVQIHDQTVGVTNIGIRHSVSGGANKWGFYGAGTAQNYFGGNVGIGDTTPATALTVGTGGLFRVTSAGAISASVSIATAGQITSTLAIGTAPFNITSTTVVPNLNVSQLLGNTWAVPGAIGATTPNTVSATVLVVSGAATFNSIVLSGNISSPAWTTTGLRIKGVTATFTDTTSTGTVAAAYTDVLGGNTIAASSATTFTNYITAFFNEPIAGANVTFTNKWALGAASARFGTSNQVTIGLTGVLAATSAVLVTPNIGVATGTSLVASGLLQAGTTLGISTDTLLERDAANTFAQRNGTNGQTFNIYQTYTDASNYQRFTILASAAGSALRVGHQNLGTGAPRDLIFITNGDKWSISAASGVYAPMADNTYDIGTTALRLRDEYIGRNLFIGATTQAYGERLSIYDISTATSGNSVSAYFLRVDSPTVNSTSVPAGVQVDSIFNAGTTITSSRQWGVYSRLQSSNTGTGALLQAYGFYAEFSQSAPRTTSVVAGFRTNVSSITAGTVTEFNAFDSVDQASANITTAYSFRGRMLSAANRWNLYLDGTASNHMAGNLFVGTTSSIAQEKFNVSATDTSTSGTPRLAFINFFTAPASASTGNTIGFQVRASAASAFTNALYGIRSDFSNATGTGTTPFWVGYDTACAPVAATVISVAYAFSSGAPTGAGTIGTWNGFAASDATATNVYGFRGGVIAGANKYNLYLDGTAQNFLAGATFIGGIADAATTFLVKGLTKGVRIGASVNAGIIEGVDNTGSATYQPLNIGGSTIALQTSGTTIATVTSTGLLIGIGTAAALLDVATNVTAASWTTSGIGLRLRGNTYTDSSTAASGTAATNHIHAIAAPTLAATNTTVTTTTAATLYIAGAPIAGTNQTITNSFALHIASGQIAAPDGSAGVPSYSFANFKTTGMYVVGGPSIIFTTGGLNSVSISSNTVLLHQTAQFGWGSAGLSAQDVFLSRFAAATLQQGALNAAAPVAQTLQAQGSRAGTDTNIGGASYTIQAGQGTGIGTASNLIFRAPIVAASGTTAQTMTTALTLNGTNAIFAVGVAAPTLVVATTITAGSAGNGAAVLNVGSASASGYVYFNSAAGVRQGFIGFSSTTASADTGTIPYIAGIHAFTGVVSISMLSIQGNATAASWTTTGIGLSVLAAAYTDSSTAASGTAASNHIHAIAAPTLAATNTTVTTTTAATLYIAGAPIAGTNQTISNPVSLLVASGQSAFAVGNGARPSIAYAADLGTGIWFSTSTINFSCAGGMQLQLVPGALYTPSIIGIGTTADCLIVRDAANNLAQRNGVNAQSFRVYTTYTNASNYERLGINTASGSLTIAAESLGTGSANISVIATPKGTGTFQVTTAIASTRINPRVISVADAASITPNADTADLVTQVNTQVAGTLTINAPTGTPVNGQLLRIWVKGTNAQTFAFNAIYRGSNDQALPTTSTGAIKGDYLIFQYNSTDTKWDFLSKTFGF